MMDDSTLPALIFAETENAPIVCAFRCARLLEMLD
jgi:hypothetical protein